MIVLAFLQVRPAAPWRIRGGALALLALATLAGCAPEPLQPPAHTGELVVVTRNSPTTYFLDADGQPAGFELDLADAFARHQGWNARFVVADTLDQLMEILASGQAHIAAAGLTATDQRRQHMRFGPTYAQVKEWVVCRQGGPIPRGVEDLVGLRLEVVAGSSHAGHLEAHRKRVPDLAWIAMKTPGADELLERVDIGLADCAIADSDSLDVARNFHPNIRPAFVLESAQPQAWAIARGLDTRFARELVKFFDGIEQSGELRRLKERYFGHVKRLREMDVVGILERRLTLLRDLRPHFHAAQSETGIDWRLLAALAYQESQWDAHAVSPTGVRGLMMLTADTADRLGVRNRLDARESILGGARYLAMLKDKLPEEVPEPDRTWLALAAYNIGPGHLNDARNLARKLGKDANAWNDMKAVLPLIARAEYRDRLRYGYARGGEARALAENVRVYYDILLKYEPPYRETDWLAGLLDAAAETAGVTRATR